MDNIINFFTKPIQLSDTLSVQTWVLFTVLLAVILAIVVLIFSTKSINKDKNKEEEAKQEEQKPALSADEASKQYFEVINKKLDLPPEINKDAPDNADDETATSQDTTISVIDQNEAVAEVKVEKEQEVTTKDVATKDVATKDVATKDVAIEKVSQEEVVIEDESEKEQPKATAESATAEDEVTATVDNVAFIKEETVEKQIAGKFAIVNSCIGSFRYALIANNGQLLYESRDYKAKRTCLDAVSKFCAAVKEGNFSVKKDKFDRFKFVLRPIGSANTLYIGESFKDRAACLSNIESVKRFVLASSPIVDRTDDDFCADSSFYQVPDEIKTAVANRVGVPGKWEIAEIDEDNQIVYEFLLYANNGQLLYESKEYKTYNSCKNGMFTFIETVQDGSFIVDSDKAGRYKFILRSNKPGSQAEYIGQFYRNADACQSSINSVYKFALISATDNL